MHSSLWTIGMAESAMGGLPSTWDDLHCQVRLLFSNFYRCVLCALCSTW